MTGSAPGADLGRLSTILGVTTSDLQAKLSEHRGYVPLAYQVTSAVEQKVAGLDLPYLSFVPDTVRTDPDGLLFTPILGIVGFSGKGLAGLEYLENSLLAGSPGSEVVPTGPNGEGLPGSPTQVAAVRQGSSLVLTLDQPLQFEVTKDLSRQITATHATSGVAIVEDRRTGGILAMVDLVAGKHGRVHPAAQNLAATSVYQPGSVMKLVTVSGALQDGLITPSSVFTVPYQIMLGGWPFSDADFHPTERLTATQILAQSSNIGTIKIAHLLGPERLSYYLRDLGFGQPSGLGWPGETAGIVPSPTDPSSWSGSSMGSVPIGTGEAVTPLQILDAYNAVANGGVLIPPRLIEATIPPSGAEHFLPPATGRRVLSRKTVSELLPMLEKVTQDGTAIAARIPGYPVAGKTGTAQIPSTTRAGYKNGAWNATFVGFAPAQNPALTTFIMLSHPDLIYGGLASAPCSPRSCGTRCTTSTSLRPVAWGCRRVRPPVRRERSCCRASGPEDPSRRAREAAEAGHGDRRRDRHRRLVGHLRPSGREPRSSALLSAGRPCGRGGLRLRGQARRGSGIRVRA